MDYRILGPLEVADGDRPVALGGDRQRAVLGQLLLHRNEVVASERLIDELWGERPPPTAGKILQNYVSQLRRALGANGSDGPLETHGRGYRLRVEPGALDLERFERCLESGREALAAGDPERAAAEFRAGLGMWRGPPLPELADTAEARVEIDRILERRVIALEGRVEADLARGRHAELIAELEAAVAHEPLRERLRAQLMLALYRSGRQAEALEVHRDGRRVLAEELGLEPGPALTRLERAILEHDPALEPPPAPRAAAACGARARTRPTLAGPAGRPPRSCSWRPRPRRSLSWAAARPRRPGSRLRPRTRSWRSTSRAGGSRRRPRSGRTRAASPPGRVRSGCSTATTGRCRASIRATRRVTRTFAIGAVPTAVAVGGGGVWIGAGPTTSDPRTQLGAGNHVGARGGADRRRLGRDRRAHHAPEGGREGVCRGRPAPAGGRRGRRLGGRARRGSGADRPGDQPRAHRSPAASTRARWRSAAAACGRSARAPYRAATIWQIEPRSGHVVRRIDVPADGLDAIVFGAGSLWGTDGDGGRVWRIDIGQPGRRPTMQTVAMAPGVGGIAFEPHGVWVTNPLDDTVSRIDPATNRVSRVIHMPAAPRDLAIGQGRVWVTLAGANGSPAAATSARPGGLAGVRGADCRPVVFAGARSTGRARGVRPPAAGHGPSRHAADVAGRRVDAQTARLPRRPLQRRLSVLR